MQQKYKDFKINLYNPRIKKTDLFNHLKIAYSFDEQQYIIERIPKTFETLIYGKSLLNKTEDFGKNRKTYYDSNEKEFNWLIFQFKRYSKEINLFLALKVKFELNFLLGLYNQSSENLKAIKDISLSYWGLENKFLQIQYEKGLEFNFKLLNSCKNQKVNDPAFFLLIHFFSYKVEEDVSYFSYDNVLENSIVRGMSDDYKEYFKYRLNIVKYDFNDIESVIWASKNLSVIDKYMTYRDIVFYMSLDMKDYSKKGFIKKNSNDLLNYINDPLIQKSNNFEGDFSIKEEENNLESELKIIDDFTRGDYLSVIEGAKKMITKKACFSCIELFAKSHLHLKIPIENIFPNNCVFNSITEFVYNYLSRNEKSNESLIDLLTISNTISSFEISKEIVSFIQRNFNFSDFRYDNLSLKRAYISSESFNPIHFLLFSDENIQKEYLKSFSKFNSLTVNFFSDIINKYDTIDEKYTDIIPRYRLTFYKAKYLYDSNKYEGCKLELLKIIPQIEELNYIKESCVTMLFDCYYNLELFNDAIDLYVDSFILNSALVTKIDSKKLSDKIIKNRWKYISHNNINFPIFIYLAHDETHPKYIAYDLYLRTLNLNHPSLLIDESSNANKKQIFFLKNVANQKIISRKVMIFKNSNSVLNERISICQILARVDNSRIEEYNKEISEITKRLTVQQRIKEIDQSKIYVDEYGILESELIEIKKGFNRFKSISELLKQNKIDPTGIGYDALYDLLKGKIDTDTYKKSLRKTDLHFELFVQLFLEIRDKFLFSNQYGLDYYLSQRIRHGTIIGQIRKPFNAFNLVTTKSSEDGNYLQNDYWNNIQLEIGVIDRIKFDQRMNNFSASIDKIINDLKDQFVQIRTEDIKTKQTGWFDYMYIPLWNSEWLYSLFIKEIQFFTDFTEFVESIFEILWEITDRNLLVVREKINSKIKEELIGELDSLEIDLKAIVLSTSSSAIFKAIADCRTNVQADVDYVIRWFNKSKNDEIDFLIEDALNTSLTIVNNINSPSVLGITQKITDQSLIKGIYFPHFVDLIKIFLTNISDYYKTNNALERSASVNLKRKDDILHIEFKNKLSDNEDPEELLIKLDKIKLDLEETNYNGIRSEGNTGFSKANNILKNVFRNQDNGLSFNLNNGTFNIGCKISLKNLLK
ncbi:hypothetical protein [Flavobacterium sp. N502540]|uniref:hypothetical protein n=1 Tax=Flavobacterium sp. N502540 TaxID=2986838 RepID=UPI002225B36E|nr:hypothetical protein [Flavobacterium sp. N502540]